MVVVAAAAAVVVLAVVVGSGGSRLHQTETLRWYSKKVLIRNCGRVLRTFQEEAKRKPLDLILTATATSECDPLLSIYNIIQR